MCLIIYKPAGKQWPDAQTLHHIWSSNPDGFGVVHRTRAGAIQMTKGLYFPGEIEKILDCTISDDEPAIAHWRLATHGGVCDRLCHPFESKAGWYLAHNGVLPKPWGNARKGQSDTTELVHALRHTSFDSLAAMPEYLGGKIGSRNKLAIMSPAGQVVLVNESEGIWIGGVWYSNLYSLPWGYERRNRRPRFREPTPTPAAAEPDHWAEFERWYYDERGKARLAALPAYPAFDDITSPEDARLWWEHATEEEIELVAKQHGINSEAIYGFLLGTWGRFYE